MLKQDFVKLNTKKSKFEERVGSYEDIKESLIGLIFLKVLNILFSSENKKRSITTKDPEQNQNLNLQLIYDCTDTVLEDVLNNTKNIKSAFVEALRVLSNIPNKQALSSTILLTVQNLKQTSSAEPEEEEVNQLTLLKGVSYSLRSLQALQRFSGESHLIIYTILSSILCSKIKFICLEGQDIIPVVVECFLYHILHPLAAYQGKNDVVYNIRPSCFFGRLDIIYLDTLIKLGFDRIIKIIIRVPRSPSVSVLQPELGKFCDFKQLNVESAVGVHSLVESFPSLFSTSFAERLISHVQLFADHGLSALKLDKNDSFTILIYVIDMFRLLSTLQNFDYDNLIRSLCTFSVRIAQHWFGVCNTEQKKLMVDVFVGVFRSFPKIFVETFSALQIEEMKDPKQIGNKKANTPSSEDFFRIIFEGEFALPIKDEYIKSFPFLFSSEKIDSFTTQSFGNTTLVAKNAEGYECDFKTYTSLLNPTIVERISQPINKQKVNILSTSSSTITTITTTTNQQRIITSLDEKVLPLILSFLSGEQFSMNSLSVSQIITVFEIAKDMSFDELKRACTNSLCEKISEETIQSIMLVASGLYKSKQISSFLFVACQTLFLSLTRNIELKEAISLYSKFIFVCNEMKNN